MRHRYGARGLSHTERLLRNKKAAEGLLWCPDCQKFLPKEKFWKLKAPNSNYGHRYYCAECENARRDTKRLSKYYKEKNGRLKEKFVELAGGCCQRCGYKEFDAGLGFHHIYPEEKECNPAGLIYGNNSEETWKELDKCCLLCMNCHLTYEAGGWRAEFVKREGLGWTVGRDLPLDDDRYKTQPENPKRTSIPKKLINPYQMTFFLLSQT